MTQHRSSPLSIVLRFFFFVLVTYIVIAFLWNSLSARPMWTFTEMVLSALCFVGFVVMLGLVVVPLGAKLLLGNSPGYQQWTAQGGRPFWDSVPSPFNPDSDLTRDTGYPEPQYTGFVPPRHWQYQCPSCNAKVEHQAGVCWRCNYGADGDSSAYYRRYGGGPPQQQPPDDDGCVDGTCEVVDPPDDWQPMG